MKIGYLLIGCLFLFNPTVHVVDVLPDFIGYLFLMAGTFRMADLNEEVALARQKFRTLLWISLLKLVLMALAGFFDETLKLLFAFSFSVAELIYQLPAFAALFSGIAYLELRLTNHRTHYRREHAVHHDGLIDVTRFADGLSAFEVYEKPRGDISADFETDISFADGRARVCASSRGFVAQEKHYGGYLLESDEAGASTRIFCLAHAICTVFPELPTIFQKETGYVETSISYSASRVRTVLLVVFVAAALVFGLIWIARMARYFAAFLHEKDFCDALRRRYEREVLPNELLWTGRSIKSFGTLCAVAFAFLLSLRMDSYYLIPEFGFGIVMLFAVRAAGGFAAHPARLRGKLLGFTLTSALSFVAWFLYSEQFRYQLYPDREAHFWLYYLPAAGLFALSMAAYMLVVSEKKKIYCRMAEKCVNFYPELASGERHRAVLAELNRRIGRLAASEYRYALASILLMAVTPLGARNDLFGLCWAIRMALSAVLLFKSLSLSSDLRAELEKIS